MKDDQNWLLYLLNATTYPRKYHTTDCSQQVEDVCFVIFSFLSELKIWNLDSLTFLLCLRVKQIQLSMPVHANPVLLLFYCIGKIFSDLTDCASFRRHIPFKLQMVSIFNYILQMCTFLSNKKLKHVQIKSYL